MQTKPFLTVIQVLGIYALLSIIRPSEWMAYFVPIILWSCVAAIMLYICGFQNLHQWFAGKLVVTAITIAIFQIVLLIFSAFFTSFGKSPYALTPIGIAINIAYFSSPLIALELSRSYLIKSCPKRKIFTGIVLTALFYAFISFPLTRLLTLGAPAEMAKFLGSDFLPALAQSVFATYLALLGGPAASIAYLGTLEAFEWLSPILPNPPWTIQAIITTLIPVVGFLSVNESLSPFKLMQLGIIGRAEVKSRIRRTKKSSSLSWITIAIIGVILVWGSTGLLGFQPSVIASGSMRPTLDVGDIAVTVQTRPENIGVGDIIQFWRQDGSAPIIHRVIQIGRAGGITYIVTKGDANDAPDDPITVTQTVGKVVLVIPKIGWVSIALKTAISTAASYIQNNFALAIALIGLTFAYSAFRIHKCRNQPLNKLKGRIRR
jgi:signal peptidase